MVGQCGLHSTAPQDGGGILAEEEKTDSGRVEAKTASQPPAAATSVSATPVLVAQAPRMVVRAAPQAGTPGQFDDGAFACCSDCNSCASAYFCFPCVAGQLAQQRPSETC